ncbi:MAG: reprolysin-like metallopeptidase, partial [Actinomycetota bacterium]
MADQGSSPAGVRAAATTYSAVEFPTGVARIKVIIHSTPTERPSSSLAQVDAVMKEVAAMYATWSGGKRTLTYEITEATVPEFDCYGSTGLWKTEAGYDHVVEYGPAKNCPHNGIGTLGGTWVRVVDDGFSARTVAHELGHNLGLSHSNNATCPDAVTPWTSCTVNEYGDWLEIMGGGMSLGVLQKSLLDWHDPTRIVVNPTGEIDLGEAPASVVIADPAGGGEYWVEYMRQASYPQLLADRILIRRTPVVTSRGSNSLLLVKSQEYAFDPVRRVFTRDLGWRAGETFTDPTG